MPQEDLGNGDKPIEKRPAFDPEKYRSKRGDIANVPTLQNALSIMKISDASDFVRVHPDAEYQTPELCFVSVPILGARDDALHLIDEGLAMEYLTAKQIKRHALRLASKPNDAFFLCIVPTQNVDNSYNRTALRAIEEAGRWWVQAISLRNEGKDEYQVKPARDHDYFPEPKWPKQSIWQLIETTFAGHTIDHENDPSLLRLLGAKPKL